MEKIIKSTSKYGYDGGNKFILNNKVLVQVTPDNYGEIESAVWQLKLSELRKRAKKNSSSSSNDATGVALQLIGVSGKKLRSVKGFHYNLDKQRIGCAQFSKKTFAMILEAAKIERKGGRTR